MTDDLRQEYGEALGLTILSLDPIQENKYCAIFLAQTPAGPRIVKKYRGEDPALAREEAHALDFYHELAMADPDLLDSGRSLLRDDRNLLCIGFVEGDPMSDVLYRARRDPVLQERLVRIMGVLGRFLRTIYDKTGAPGEGTSPFIFEYMDYCSRRLEKAPVVSRFFRGLQMQAESLRTELEESGITPSFVHGDFVFKNIHVQGDRVGLIDFANTNPRSHPLNDIYNLRMALSNMVLPTGFKKSLLANLYDGFGGVSFPAGAHHFYYEYHRRRWLMLKLLSGGIRGRIQGIRGLITFARPFREDIITP